MYIFTAYAGHIGINVCINACLHIHDSRTVRPSHASTCTYTHKWSGIPSGAWACLDGLLGKQAGSSLRRILKSVLADRAQPAMLGSCRVGGHLGFDRPRWTRVRRLLLHFSSAICAIRPATISACPEGDDGVGTSCERRGDLLGSLQEAFLSPPPLGADSRRNCWREGWCLRLSTTFPDLGVFRVPISAVIN